MLEISREHQLAVLVEARALIAKGWTKGRAMLADMHGNRRYCAVGAVDVAATNQQGTTPPGASTSSVAIRVLERIRRHLPKQSHMPCIVDWNDDPCRTREEVLAVFDTEIQALTKELAAQRTMFAESSDG